MNSKQTSTLILVRDVSDLRRREQALLGKDAAIREIHHRVKNNLQTVASLLRLQGRRLTDESAKIAIAEAGRRVATIAVVHDLLAHNPGDVVDFDEVAARVVRLTIETGIPIEVDLHMDFQQTPRIRDIFRRMLKNLIHDGDMWGMVSTGTSSISIDLTYDRALLDDAINRISGNGQIGRAHV